MNRQERRRVRAAGRIGRALTRSVVLVLGMLGLAQGVAQTILSEDQKLAPQKDHCYGGGNTGDCVQYEFGIAVGIDGDTLMGAVTTGKPNEVSTYDFNVIAHNRDADGVWRASDRLYGHFGPEAPQHSLFEIAVDGRQAIVGVPIRSAWGEGVVDFYYEGDAGSWVRTDSTMYSEEYSYPEDFGYDVDLHGGTALIDGKVFEEDGGEWTLKQVLDPELASVYYQPEDRGDFDGETIVTSSPEYGVRIWRQEPAGEWVVIQSIPEPDGQAGTGFGEAVGVDGDLLLVAAPEADGPGEDAGAVHAYLRGSDGLWAHVGTLTPNDAGPGSRFGDRLVLDGENLLVRAPGDAAFMAACGTVTGGGTVYWFEHRQDGEWIERGKLVASDGYEGDRFAYDFDLSGNTAVVGAPGRPAEIELAGCGDEYCYYRVITPPEPGAVYVFELPAEEPVNQLVRFDPDPSTYYFTRNRTGCPDGYAGKFGFEAQLANLSQSTLFGLQMRVARLSGGNMVLTADGSTVGEGDSFRVSESEGYSDGLLSPSEFVDVPFTICLRERRRFRFMVDVLGRVQAP